MSIDHQICIIRQEKQKDSNPRSQSFYDPEPPNAVPLSLFKLDNPSPGELKTCNARHLTSTRAPDCSDPKQGQGPIFFKVF